MGKNEVTKKETTAVANTIPEGLSFGLENVTSKDIKIPLIYVAQAMSKVCADGLAAQGDIVENMENKVLGGKKVVQEQSRLPAEGGARKGHGPQPVETKKR